MSRRRLTGGDLAETWQVGDTVEKTYDRAELAEAEAAGLDWVRVPGGPPVPRVLGLRAGTLVLEHVPPGSPSAAGAERLGGRLAVLHAAGAAAYGAAPSAHVFVGTVRLDVGEQPDWAALWQARTATLLDLLPGVDRGPYDRVGARLDRLVPPVPPARVHGDLWSGNLHWDAGGEAWLIDPAAHGGHPELDPALLALFGAPHLELLLASWAAASGAADGWRDRLALHQVHTLLFHAVAFGGGYLARAGRAVAAYL